MSIRETNGEIISLVRSDLNQMQLQKALLLLQVSSVQLVCLFVYLRQSITSMFRPLVLLNLLDTDEKALLAFF
jgi:hypothetical protein